MTNDELITMAEAAIKLYEDAGVSGEAGANLIADLIAALKASEALVHSLENAVGWYGHQVRLCRQHGKEGDEARIRASLDMIDPDALVAGAYEAAIRACINMGLLTEHPNDAGAVVLRAITPADAQAALDAAINKAVNEKLDEVAARAVEWAMKNPDEDMILNVFAEEILAMKEEG